MISDEKVFSISDTVSFQPLGKGEGAVILLSAVVISSLATTQRRPFSVPLTGNGHSRWRSNSWLTVSMSKGRCCGQTSKSSRWICRPSASSCSLDGEHHSAYSLPDRAVAVGADCADPRVAQRRADVAESHVAGTAEAVSWIVSSPYRSPRQARRATAAPDG